MPHSFLSLGDFRYDAETGFLQNTADDIINLRPQSAQILAILARQLGQVVLKQDLLDEVWPNISVTEDSLVQCISDIRKAIEDKSRTVLRTVPKRGYMLVAAEAVFSSSPAAPAQSLAPPNPVDFDTYGYLMRDGACLFVRAIETIDESFLPSARQDEYWNDASALLQNIIRKLNDGDVTQSINTGAYLEFRDTKNAILCALEMSKWCTQRRFEMTGAQSLSLSVGIDVRRGAPDNDAFAARIHAMATLAGPCEVVASADVMAAVTAGLDCDFIDMGDCTLPNFSDPVRCFKVLHRSAKAMIKPILSPEDLLPTIAVVPFVSRMPDPAAKVVGEVLADDVISMLSRSLQINVISRLSTTSFRHRDATMAEIGATLDANYVLSGRYTHQGSKLDIDLQLSDVASGRILWADRMAHDVGQMFDTPETVEWIVAGVQRAIYTKEVAHARQTPLPNLQTYTLLMSAVSLMHRLSPHDFTHARTLLEALIERAPMQATPLAWMSRWHVLRVQQGWSSDPHGEAQLALDCTKRALDLDPDNVLALVTEGQVLTNLLRKMDDAEERYDRALELNPNDPVGRLLRGTMYAFRDQGAQAVRETERSLHLTPLDPLRFFFLSLAATACISAEDYERALEFSTLSLRANRTHTSTLRVKAVAQLRTGQPDAARETGRALLALQPGLRVSEWLQSSPGRHYDIGRRFGEDLREIGIPE